MLAELEVCHIDQGELEVVRERAAAGDELVGAIERQLAVQAGWLELAASTEERLRVDLARAEQRFVQTSARARRGFWLGGTLGFGAPMAFDHLGRRE